MPQNAADLEVHASVILLGHDDAATRPLIRQGRDRDL